MACEFCGDHAEWRQLNNWGVLPKNFGTGGTERNRPPCELKSEVTWAYTRLLNKGPIMRILWQNEPGKHTIRGDRRHPTAVLLYFV